jgi:HSP20 family protein
MALFQRELFDPFDWNMAAFDPFRETRRLQRDLNRLERTTDIGLWSPFTDIKECGDHMELDLELPGVKKDDINLELRNGILTISGEKKEEKKKETERMHRVERTYGR